ncbi:MAG: DUF2807 domain-containing protein [Treponema sp.]|jgi:hypothetical protein|nr:DUF2807 domain-containing protein [Treponema sp.]
MLIGKLSVVSAVMALFAAGSKDRGGGEVSAVEHTPPAFEVLYIRANADVKVHYADTPKVVIAAPSNLHGQIELRTKKNELEIRVKGKEEKFPRFSVDVYTPPLSGLGAAFAATLEFSGDVTRSGFMVGQAGVAEIRGTLECETIQVNMAGSGIVRLSGSARKMEINLVGDGTIDAKEFRTDSASVQIVGEGKIITWTTGVLTTNIVGNGTISYRGDPVMEFTGVGTGRFIRLPDNS